MTMDEHRLAGHQELQGRKAYCMGSEVSTSKVGHAIQASEGCPTALTVVRVELLLGENISAVLKRQPVQRQRRDRYGRVRVSNSRLFITSHEKDTIAAVTL